MVSMVRLTVWREVAAVTAATRVDRGRRFMGFIRGRVGCGRRDGERAPGRGGIVGGGGQVAMQRVAAALAGVGWLLLIGGGVALLANDVSSPSVSGDLLLASTSATRRARSNWARPSTSDRSRH